MENTTIMISKELNSRLGAICQATGMSRPELIARMVSEYEAEQQRKAKEQETK